MHRITVNLTPTSYSALGRAATAMRQTKEEIFEYLLRNVLQIYTNLDFRGRLVLITKNIEQATMMLAPPRVRIGIQNKVRGIFERSPASIDSEGTVTPFTALVSDEIYDQVLRQAGQLGFNDTAFINRLVSIGGDLAVHLAADGAVFAFDSAGNALGQVRFS